MSVAIDRKLTSFRLRRDLLDLLQKAAKKENRSLNNYVESALMEYLANTPNQKTLLAMKEADADLNLKKVDTTNFEAFVKSCSE